MTQQIPELRISFRITGKSLIDAYNAKLEESNIPASRYIRDLIERDLAGNSPAELDRKNPIGDLINRLLYFRYDAYLEALEIAKQQDRDPDEGTLLINLLDQCLKILQNPDRSDLAIMTRGELEEAMLASYKQAKYNPSFNIETELRNLAGLRIDAAKRRPRLKDTGEKPEPLNTDPEIEESAEGRFIWISREEFRKTVRDFIRAEHLVPKEQIDKLLEILYNPDLYAEHLEIAKAETSKKLTETQKRADAQLEKDIDKLKKNKNETA